MTGHGGVSAATEWTFVQRHIESKAHCSQQVLETPTGLVRQHWSQCARQSGRERLGQTGRALAVQHRHCHGSMGTQNEDLGQTAAARHWREQRATDAVR
jgi:hypothetical protein